MLENWGGMTKAQDDSTTIDEAIASAILAHEEDSESHMGAGESIENHRENEVIDHPQGSVVADKGASGQISIPFTFDNISYWDKTAYQYVLTNPGILMSTSTVADNWASIYLQEYPIFKADSFAKNLMWQIVVETDYSNNGDYIFYLGCSSADEGLSGISFEIVNGTLKGYQNDGYTTENVTLCTWVPGKYYTLRYFANLSTGKGEFWVNGELLGEIALTAVYDEEQHLTPLFQVTKKRNSGQASIYIYFMLTARDL